MIKEWFKKFLQRQQEKIDNCIDTTPPEAYEEVLNKLKSDKLKMLAYKWAANNSSSFGIKKEYVEFIYLKGLRKGLILAKQEIQKRMVDIEDNTVLLELQKMMESIDALLAPSSAPEQ